jgi:hypothetical protein
MHLLVVVIGYVMGMPQKKIRSTMGEITARYPAWNGEGLAAKCYDPALGQFLSILCENVSNTNRFECRGIPLPSVLYVQDRDLPSRRSVRHVFDLERDGDGAYVGRGCTSACIRGV